MFEEARGQFSKNFLTFCSCFFDKGVILTFVINDESGLISIPIPRLPEAIDSIIVVPPPINGSTIVSLGFVKVSMMERTKIGENLAG